MTAVEVRSEHRVASVAVSAPTIATGLDPRRNALNAIRLALALLVIVWHSFPLTGDRVAFGPLAQLMGDFSVDGFFAISGFLIVQSWTRTPKVLTFLRARVLRIFPAFWVSLLVTALVIAPLSLILRGQAFPVGFWHDAGRYVLRNWLLWVNQYPIAHTPTDVPYPGVWNGSMWTLAWEFLCYLGVLALGVVGFLRRRWVVPALFVLALAGVWVSALGIVDNFFVTNGSRFGVMFLAGALLFRFRNRIPLRGWLIVCSAVVVAAASWLPSYLMFAAPALAYLMIGLGALGRHPRLRFRNDLSYGCYIFAFPMQQLLASLGLWRWGPAVFAPAGMIVTLCVATGSWFLVERPSLRLKGGPRRRRESAGAASTAASETTDRG